MPVGFFSNGSQKTAQRRRKLELQQLERISYERLRDAEANFLRLYRLTEEAMNDADPHVRLFRLYNEAEAAREEYEEAKEMRWNYSAMR